ncbi:hypothetical protein MTO96_040146 [Rhipicephalus appendiculatus]
MNAPRIVVQIASQILAYTNSCVNPFLYAFLSDNFRKSFRKVICCGRKPPYAGGSSCKGRSRAVDDAERTRKESSTACVTKLTKVSNDIL